MSGPLAGLYVTRRPNFSAMVRNMEDLEVGVTYVRHWCHHLDPDDILVQCQPSSEEVVVMSNPIGDLVQLESPAGSGRVYRFSLTELGFKPGQSGWLHAAYMEHVEQ